MLRTPATETQITHGGRLWLYVLGGLILLFLILPSLLVIPLSFSDSRYLAFPPPGWSTRWYEAYFSAIEWRDATVVSFTAADPWRDESSFCRARDIFGPRYSLIGMAVRRLWR